MNQATATPCQSVVPISQNFVFCRVDPVPKHLASIQSVVDVCRSPLLLVLFPQSHAAASMRWCSLTFTTLCDSGLHLLRRVWRSWNACRGGQQSWWRSWNTCPVRSRWGFQVCLVWRKEGWGETSLVSTASSGRDTGRCSALLLGIQWQDTWEYFKTVSRETV